VILTKGHYSNARANAAVVAAVAVHSADVFDDRILFAVLRPLVVHREVVFVDSMVVVDVAAVDDKHFAVDDTVYTSVRSAAAASRDDYAALRV